VFKAHRLAEVRELLATPSFQAWWTELNTLQGELTQAREKHEELLTQAQLMDFRAELVQKDAIDTLYRAGESEDAATQQQSQADALENQGLQALAQFESQRVITSEVWYRLNASTKAGDQAQPDPALAAQYQKENHQKSQLWDEVERLWAKSAELSLSMAEKRLLARKVRRHAEARFAQADERKRRSAKLRLELDASHHALDALVAKVADHLQTARERFACSTGEEFLYFRDRDHTHRAFAVSLVNDSQTYNIEVKALGLYVVDHKKGIETLAPAVDQPPSVDEGDARFESFFLSRGKAPTSSGS
jgi:hypothetical protein